MSLIGVADKIVVSYRAVDGCHDKRTFKTLNGARRYAANVVGDHPEMGSYYAVSFDGIGRVTVSGCSLVDLFPRDHTQDR